MKRHTQALWRLVAVASALMMVAAACGDDDDDTTAGGDNTETTAESTVSSGETTAPGTGTETTATPDTTAPGAAPEGELILGAEQWPECLNPVTQCFTSSWMHWATIEHVLPRLMELDPGSNHVPSPLLAGDPVLSGEGAEEGSSDPFTITYALNPAAVWNDGSPITCADVEFTRQAYLETTGTVGTTGYEDIDTVECPDPQTVIVTFTKPYAPWADLFGGANNYVLKADYFEGNPDIADVLNTDMPFSGGPFILESFDETQAILTANTAYWDPDRIPLVERVIMIPQADTDTELNALKAGEVMGIYPQPRPDIIEQLDQDNLSLSFGAGSTFEGLWLGQQSTTADSAQLIADPIVREALLYAIDRELILTEVIHPSFPDVELLNCAFWVPSIGDWCDTTDYADVSYDAAKVAELLEGDGWALGGDGIYEKEGQRLSIKWQTVQGNARREAIQRLIIPAVAEIGIELVADNSEPGQLFEVRLPNRDFEIGLFAQVASPDPTATTSWACDQIPTEENDFSGQNYYGWCNEEATDLLKQSDETPDREARVELIHQAGDLMREDVVAIPFYQLPLIMAWDTDQIEGPIDLYTSTGYSAFFNMFDWSVKA